MRRSMLFLPAGLNLVAGTICSCSGAGGDVVEVHPGAAPRKTATKSKEDQRTIRGEDIQFMAEKLSIRSHRGRFVDNAHLADDGCDVILESRMQ